jgi:hypothetical protein
MIVRWYSGTGYLLGERDVSDLEKGCRYHTAQNKSRWGFAVFKNEHGMTWYKRGKKIVPHETVNKRRTNGEQVLS